MFMDSATSGWCSDLLYGLRVLLFCHPTPHASPTQFRTESADPHRERAGPAWRVCRVRLADEPVSELLFYYRCRREVE